jgi:acyl-[acyl-carrier-protein]-phospholipid O-acyltransferase/long-chain-fatty-acid--[acyl-carrier-protein] ligase
MTPSSPAPTTPQSFRFRAFLLAELLGVLNDNALRMAIQAHVVLNVEAAPDRGFALAAAGLLFALPFILFSWLAGWLSDRFPKHRVILGLKLVEVAVCLFVLIALQGEVSLIWAGLGLMAVQSALFSPSKYGILPEVLEDRFLSYGNGLVNLTTFVAMAGGAAIGILVAGRADSPSATDGFLFVALAIAGAGAAAFVPRSAAAQPDLAIELNPFRRHREDWAFLREHPSLPAAVLGVAFFYFLAALFQLSLLLDLQERFVLGAEGVAALVGTLAIGLGLGSYLAGRWSDEKIELGLVPLGAILISVFSLIWAAIPPEPIFAGIALLGVGLGAGFFVIPLVCLIQQKSPLHAKGRVIALANVFNFTAIALASLIVGALAVIDLLPPQSWILGVGLLAALATAAALSLIPLFFVRFTVWLMAHTIYRIRVENRQNIPRQGPALLIPNHVSWVDAIIVQSTMQRFVRFMMFRPFYEFRPTHWFFREAHVIPVAKGDPPEKTEASLQQAADELAQGHLVLIFAEGKLTRTGDLSPFRQGYRRILDKLPPDAQVPIIPVGLSGLWGSVFSHEGGRFLWKWPRRFPYDVTLRYGDPLPTDTPPERLQEAVQALIDAP